MFGRNQMIKIDILLLINVINGLFSITCKEDIHLKMSINTSWTKSPTDELIIVSCVAMMPIGGLDKFHLTLNCLSYSKELYHGCYLYPISKARNLKHGYIIVKSRGIKVHYTIHIFVILISSTKSIVNHSNRTQIR